MERLACIMIGYAFGLIQTGYLYGKTQNVDIRKQGSGNAGTTNALRTLGWKAGLITFLGDCFKCVAAVVVAYFLFGRNHQELFPVYAMYAGMGAVLGHNYPFYMNFKGGKGIAATAGLIVSTTNVWMVLICLAVFVTVVAITKYVSVGSMVVVIVYYICVITLAKTGAYGAAEGHLYEIYIIGALLVISAFYKHKENIKRLLSGTENKLSVGKGKNKK